MADWTRPQGYPRCISCHHVAREPESNKHYVNHDGCVTCEICYSQMDAKQQPKWVNLKDAVDGSDAYGQIAIAVSPANDALSKFIERCTNIVAPLLRSACPTNPGDENATNHAAVISGLFYEGESVASDAMHLLKDGRFAGANQLLGKLEDVLNLAKHIDYEISSNPAVATGFAGSTSRTLKSLLKHQGVEVAASTWDDRKIQEKVLARSANKDALRSEHSRFIIARHPTPERTPYSGCVLLGFVQEPISYIQKEAVGAGQAITNLFGELAIICILQSHGFTNEMVKSIQRDALQILRQYASVFPHIPEFRRQAEEAEAVLLRKGWM